MIVLSKSELKARMLQYFREIEKTGKEILVTDNRKIVLKVIPFKKKKSAELLFGDIRGKVKYNEDIMKSETKEWGDV